MTKGDDATRSRKGDAGKGSEPARRGISLFDLLADEHRRIAKLFAAMDEINVKNIDPALKTFARLEEELMTHLEGEERFFYAALELHDEASGQVLEAYEENLIAKTLLASFKSLALDDHRWKAKIMVLRKLFDLHMREEEHLIEKAQRLLPPPKAQEITKQLTDFRERGGRTKAVGEPVSDL